MHGQPAIRGPFFDRSRRGACAKTIESAGQPIAGLRVGIKKGGCAGMAYTIDLADEVRPADEVIEDQGVKSSSRRRT